MTTVKKTTRNAAAKKSVKMQAEKKKKPVIEEVVLPDEILPVVTEESPVDEMAAWDVHTSPEHIPTPSSSRRPLIALVVLVFTILGIAYHLVQSESSEVSVQAAAVGAGASSVAIDSVLEAVKKHVVITETEGPLIATVVDPETLVAEQSFYAGVQKDDVVLIFSESRRAIIYSPARDIVVNMGPVVVNDTVAGTETLE